MSLNLIKDQRLDIGEIYLYVKEPSESMFQLLMNERENIIIEAIKNPREFIQYSKTIHKFMKIRKIMIQQKKTVLIVFDDMIADTESKKNNSYYY